MWSGCREYDPSHGHEQRLDDGRADTQRSRRGIHRTGSHSNSRAHREPSRDTLEKHARMSTGAGESGQRVDVDRAESDEHDRHRDPLLCMILPDEREIVR